MRFLILCGVALTGLFPQAGKAADIDQKGADAINSTISRYAPEMVKSGALKASPAGDHYELKVDINSIIKSFGHGLRLSDATPIIAALIPHADRMWEVSAKGRPVTLSGDYASASQPRHFELRLGGYEINEIFDPVIHHMPTAKYVLHDVDFVHRGTSERFAVSAKDFAITTNISEPKPNSDVSADFTAHDFVETRSVNGSSEPFVELVGKAINGHVTVLEISQVGIRTVIRQWLQKEDGTDSALKSSQAEEMRSVLAQYGPVIGGFNQRTTISNASLKVDGVKILADTWVSEFGVGGLRKDGEATFGAVLHNPSVAPGLLPHAYEVAIPDDFSLHLVLTGFAFKKAFSISTNKDPNLNDSMRMRAKRLEDSLLPNGRIYFQFKDTFVRSKYYDFNITGSASLNAPNKKDDTRFDVMITARNIAKTISFLQSNAGKAPEFGKASFMFSMMKGFGKQETDGAMTWNLKTDQTGKVLINGHEMPH